MGRKYIPKESEEDSKEIKKSKGHRRSGGKGRSRKFNNKPNTTNDPAWYGTSPELVRDAASIPFSWPIGTAFGISPKINADSSPGIMTFFLQSGVGCSYDEQSPINVASSAIYSFVRHANSGHSNYDAPDLMIYLLAMSSVYSFITWCQRLLGAVNMYDQRNRYMPKAIINANSVDYEDLRNNIANFRFWLNNFIIKASSLVVPNTMPVFQRLAFLFANIYIDGPTVKDQMYQYAPSDLSWLQFALDQDDKGSLIYASIQRVGTYATVAEIETFGDSLFNAIWEQEDFGIMSGDILKAYQGNIIKLAPIPLEMGIVPIFDPMVLHQMKNAKMFNLINSAITQDANGLILASVSPNTVSPLDGEWTNFTKDLDSILTSDFDQPGPDVVIESTRLMVGYEKSTGRWSTGLEICRGLRVSLYSTYSNQIATTDLYPMKIALTAASHTKNDVRERFRDIALLKAFKYAPEMFAIYYTYSGGVFSIDDYDLTRIWDIDNYAVLSPHDIAKMHQAALMSLFAVPAIAKLS